jgi:hypothetical protein
VRISASADPQLRAPQARTPWSRCWLEGAGAAILLAPGLIWTELSQTHIDQFHRLLPLNTVARALAIDLVILSLVAMLALRGIETLVARFRGRGPSTFRDFILLVWALWFGLLAARAVAGLIVAQLLWWQQITTRRGFILAAGLLLILWLALPQFYPRAVRALRFAVMLLGFCIFWMVPALLVAAHAHQPYDQAAFRKLLPAQPTPHQRIVWLLFDELSYDQAFVHRWPGLSLPNFDNLRARSVTFSEVQPDGFYTEDVIPSLFLGKPIADVRGTPSGWMNYQSQKHGPWQPFDGGRTLFADAQRAGWTTGAIGEYNPYCRVLQDQLDFCRMAMPPLPDHFSRDKSTLENVIAPLAANWNRARSHGNAQKNAAAEPTVDAMGTVRAGSDLIGDTGIDLCFVHLPFPHPPGNYNRRTGKVGPGGSYIDNLALSDKVLGLLLADIAQNDDADRTTVIVSSDHSWRVWLWRFAYGWSREDEEASRHGQFDPRPVLMVSFPRESSGITDSKPVPLLGMHDLVEGMMSGQIENEQQLEAWATQQ